MSTTVKLYSLNFDNVKTYLFAAAFVVGNLALPQLAHLVPQGGLIFLPIYFFTLIAAYKYGIRVGLLTAVLSPIINSLIFGMPMVAMLPIILTKSVLLAVGASMAANYFKKVSLLGIILAVIAYQVIGFGAEWAMTHSFAAAISDFKIGYPGILLQIFGGYFCLKALEKV